MSAVFELLRVFKRFSRQVALDGVTLTGEPGTVVALLGENGAGKSTALRILLGLLEPDGGSSRVLGLDSWAHGEMIRRQVGYVPDRPTLYEWMTVDEIGWFCGGFYDPDYVPTYRRMVSEFGLPLKKKIGTMSKGMKAKVSLSLAMAHEPQLLVLDEPTSGLDPIVRREFLESMVDVAASGRTVLLSSHQISEVERVADVVAILRDGRLEVVERLDVLKSTMRELTVTLRNGSSDIPKPPGAIIHRIQEERQWRLLVRHFEQRHLDEFRKGENVGAVEVRHPSLEEIYVGYMQGERPVESNP
jgi:ABC-2 type transport system ATP-binding protein